MGEHANAVDVGYEMTQIAHMTTRPVVDEILEEVLVVEDKIGGGARQVDVDVPRLHLVPDERIVDVDVETQLFGEQELVECQTRRALHRVELAHDRRLVTVLFREPRYAALELRWRVHFETLQYKFKKHQTT